MQPSSRSYKNRNKLLIVHCMSVEINPDSLIHKYIITNYTEGDFSTLFHCSEYKQHLIVLAGSLAQLFSLSQAYPALRILMTSCIGNVTCV